MNFTKNFKWQLVLVALSASLLMTGKVYSQEIENTNFETPATSVGSNFNTPAPMTTDSSSNLAGVAYATSTAIANAIPVNEQTEANVTSAPVARGTLLALVILLVGYAMIRKASGNRWNDRKNTLSAASAVKNTLFPRKPQALHS